MDREAVPFFDFLSTPALYSTQTKTKEKRKIGKKKLFQPWGQSPRFGWGPKSTYQFLEHFLPDHLLLVYLGFSLDRPPANNELQLLMLQTM